MESGMVWWIKHSRNGAGLPSRIAQDVLGWIKLMEIIRIGNV
jgi:hypothetical protein